MLKYSRPRENRYNFSRIIKTAKYLGEGVSTPLDTMRFMGPANTVLLDALESALTVLFAFALDPSFWISLF